MPDVPDAQRLIAEVKVRPTLWDVRSSEYKDRTNTPFLWQEIADVLKLDVESCKRKWKNLRDAYRAEVRRTERRVERLKDLGHYDPKMCTTSKWVYFEPMSFINVSKRNKYSLAPDPASISLDNSMNDQLFNSFCDIKMEPHHTTDEDDADADLEDDDNERLFEEFKSVATPQATRRLSNSLSLAHIVDDEAAGSSGAGPGGGDGGTGEPGCKCSKRADDQVHFLESLKREEQQLMQSTRLDMTRADTLSHVGDADYNFLVSFLPQMKKMSELQNLQFRAKMSEQLLRIMTPPPIAPATPTMVVVQPHTPMALAMEGSEPDEYSD